MSETAIEYTEEPLEFGLKVCSDALSNVNFDSVLYIMINHNIHWYSIHLSLSS